jgi:serine acetyltransferase
MEHSTEKFTEFLHEASQAYENEVPSGSDTHAFVEKAMDLLFPFRTKNKRSLGELNDQLQELATELESIGEVILCYPGFFSIAVYRLAHELQVLGVPVLPRVMTEYAHGKTGVDIHPGARIGNSFFIDHGTGTVIGETAVIGNNVKIYQGVTLGALFVRKSILQ